MTPLVRFPAGQITPHGAYDALSNRVPTVKYRSYDDQCVFAMMGGESIADYMTPEAIKIKKLKGLVAPWQNIKQKGATQDGETFVNSLYDPTNVDITIEAIARDSAHLRRLLDHWRASWDAKQPGELSWFTHELGRWWASVRWAKPPMDFDRGGAYSAQELTWPAVAYDAFWRSYDHAELFKIPYEDSVDDFDYTTASELGSGWTVHYSDDGSGLIHTDGTQVIPTLDDGRSVVCRRNSYTTSDDNQIVELTIGSFPEGNFPGNAYVDTWARLNNTGTPGTSGDRLRIGNGALTLSYFTSGTEHVMRTWPLPIPPASGEKFTLAVFGRGFRAFRNGVPITTFVESGANSPLSSGNRACGFGLQAGDVALANNAPADVFKWNAGTNVVKDGTAFIPRVNVGDQPMFDRYTCLGPGTFAFADGPGSSNVVLFGPLPEGAAAQIRTDPRKRGVVGLSAAATSAITSQTLFGTLLYDFVSFATANNVPSLLSAIRNIFGVVEPAANIYSLLQGRFSDNAGIPPKPTGSAAPVYHVGVAIVGGNSLSGVLAAGTPLRRNPY